MAHERLWDNIRKRPFEHRLQQSDGEICSSPSNDRQQRRDQDSSQVFPIDTLYLLSSSSTWFRSSNRMEKAALCFATQTSPPPSMGLRIGMQCCERNQQPCVSKAAVFLSHLYSSPQKHRFDREACHQRGDFKVPPVHTAVIPSRPSSLSQTC